jgi:hypothetical protein
MTWAGVCATAAEVTNGAHNTAAARLPNNVVVRRVVFMISPSITDDWESLTGEI